MFRSTQWSTIRDAAKAKHDTNILAIASRELVAAEACYHTSCYRNHTRPTGERVSGTGSADDKEYNIKSEVHRKLFDYTRSNILGNPRLVKFTEITQQLVLFVEELGVRIGQNSPPKKAQDKFKSLLQFEDLLGNNRLFVSLRNYHEFSWLRRLPNC